MEPLLLRALLVGVLVVMVVVLGRLWQRRDGRVKAAPQVDGPVLADGDLDALGLDLRGAGAAAVLFGSPTCAPCERVKQVLGELESERDGFRWVYADAAQHLDMTRAHRVMRVPTLLLVEPTGRVLARTSGVPRTDDLRRVLDGGDPATLAA